MSVPLPPGTKLLDLQMADGAARADLSKEVLTGDETTQSAAIISGAVTRTLKQFPGVTSVVLLVEGEEGKLPVTP